MTEVINENTNLKHQIDLEKRTQRENSLEGQAWITKNRTKKRIHANLSGTKYPLGKVTCDMWKQKKTVKIFLAN